ncbi:MarR family transcriptional regulator for hemolysin [Pseudoduganella lurida]|uniref:MarR family transcriptional regulator for hemolysin n=1 Tax=Pseudoduganella lurida TaxID=1036180 RepID=A0A562RLS5_9BURK|nr:MarR family transcriptional regulator [Pseudoduganella lurida]TWI69997.1 MarR family transcriptional regulator for hemolysin [Pseudoduganella lurida]
MSNVDKTLMSLTHTLLHVSRAYKAAADRMASDFELSHASAWPVLMIGRLGDGARPGAVADAVGVEAPSLVRIIDQLVASGLVLRQDDPSDRRAKTLHLSAEGKQCAARLEKALVPFRRELFGDMPLADLEACVRVLTRLDATLAAQSRG